MASRYDVKERGFPLISTSLDEISGSAQTLPVSLYEIDTDGLIPQALSTASSGNWFERVGMPALELVPKSARPIFSEQWRLALAAGESSTVQFRDFQAGD